MSGAVADPPSPTAAVAAAPSLGGPKQILAAALHRLLHPRPVVLETRRPVEVPVITEVKRLWQRGHPDEAIRFGYAAVLRDLQRAFHVSFPADWTHEDILERGVTEAMVPIPEFLHTYLRLYAPVRYGRGVPEGLPSPEGLLQSIYAHPAMWALYLSEVPRPDLDPRALPSDAVPEGRP